MFENPTTPVLQVEGLTKEFPTPDGPKKVLAGIDLTVTKGEFVSIVGPSGAGKTTLLRCLSGLSPATSGTVTFEGDLVRNPPKKLGVVFQDYSRSLLPWKTVQDNIELPLKSAGMERSVRREKATTMLKAVGLEGGGRLFPRQMSGGMQQRVAIARALAAQPDLLLMDEPFGALDAQTRQELQDLVLQVRHDFGVTVVFVTHDIDEAVYLSDKIVVLSKAPTTVTATVPVNLARPRHPVNTKSDPRFAALRTEVVQLVRGESSNGTIQEKSHA